MSLKLYERVGCADNHRPSPFPWRVRLAAAHKGLTIDEHVPVLFHDKEIIGFSNQPTVPVLVDGDKTVVDSWAIAEYLEDTYGDKPSLFGGPEGKSLARFVNHWVDGVLFPALAPLVIGDLFKNIDPSDQDYFRKTREARLGRPLESFADDRAAFEANLEKVLTPLRAQLGERDWVSGEAPAHADYLVFSVFQFARCASDQPVLKADDSLRPWINRMISLHDGLADTVLCFDQSYAA